MQLTIHIDSVDGNKSTTREVVSLTDFVKFLDQYNQNSDKPIIIKAVTLVLLDGEDNVILNW